MIDKKANHLARLKKQTQILKNCISDSISLASALRDIGWTYDDLVYHDFHEKAPLMSRYYSLPDFSQKENDIPVVSFFSGAGGLDLGLESVGFNHLALVEKNPLFCDTLRHNRPNWTVLGPPDFSGDVSDFEAMIEKLDPIINANFDGLFVGGPPCQPFSIAANQRFSKKGENFKRVGFSHATNGNLLFDYIELIKKYRPSAFLIENVTGLLDVDGGAQLQRAYRELQEVGYTVNEPIVLIAAEHFVPQNRTRLFIVGNRLGKTFTPPKPTGSQLNCASVFELSLTGLTNHITREHNAESITRYMRLEYGARDQLGRVDRLDPNLPSKTVIAGGTAGGGRSHLHPYIPRTLSVRECARLQTFPDEYVFLGPSARQFTQVGNAVPPVLSAQLGKAIFSSFFS